MERFTLTPKETEIVVNNGSVDGAVDLFSYGPEMEPAARMLGSLYVIGWRQADTNTMGYMVSLIAALARREYYAQPSAAPRDAFARTLRRINEVVDEFFKSAGVELAVGIFAISGGNIMVSKLDKFKILLARDGQVVDILNNVMLFSKEHLEKRQFSSIISGSVQAGDRLLAYHPAKAITGRERAIKALLLAEDGPLLAARLAQLGEEHPEFSASFVHVDMVQAAAAVPTPAPAEPEPVAPAPPPAAAPESPAPTPTLAWAPRQGGPAPAASPAPTRPAAPAERQEIPNIIPTEYSLATRRGPLSRLLGGIRFVRLDTRGKAIVLALLALVVAGGALTARSLWFTDPEQEEAHALLEAVAADVRLAQTKTAADAPGEARTILVRALASLAGSATLADDKEAARLTASIVAAMDGLDHAQSATPSVLAQPDPVADRISLATWSSASQSIWAVSSAEGVMSVIQIRDGSVAGRTILPEPGNPDIILGWNDGVLLVDSAARRISRVSGGQVRTYDIPVQETVLDAAPFAGALYVLTDRAILRISDLDTAKPVTKRWLTSDADLASGAARIWVDGNIYTLGRDGVLTTYFKGKKISSAQAPLVPSGAWRLIPTASVEEVAVASPDRMRVYVISLKDGALVRTLKLDSQQPVALMSEGPGGSTLFVSQDNRIWTMQ